MHVIRGQLQDKEALLSCPGRDDVGLSISILEGAQIAIGIPLARRTLRALMAAQHEITGRRIAIGKTDLSRLAGIVRNDRILIG